MNRFDYVKAADSAGAVRDAGQPGSRYLGGGTNLLDLMRESIETPALLVDVANLSTAIERRADGVLRIGAAASNTAVASSPLVLDQAPLLAQAILNGASGQIRNMATVGGNIMQRTRCLYFYDLAAHCNKRTPGAGCDAREGHHRNHAVLGASPACISTHPSDMCVALAALDAQVHLAGPAGERVIPLAELHRLPGQRPDRDHTLNAGELITAIELVSVAPSAHCAYRKVRDRASYAFALVSVAAMLDIENGVIRAARIALGGVAPKPWRAHAAEGLLSGTTPSAGLFAKAAAAALEGADPLPGNAFKLPLARALVAATLNELAGLEDQT